MMRKIRKIVQKGVEQITIIIQRLELSFLATLGWSESALRLCMVVAFCVLLLPWGFALWA